MPPALNSLATSETVTRIRSGLTAGFAGGKLELPVLPLVASQVMALANNPDADIADLSDLIHRDQALAGNVLRVANSAAYSVGEPIVSLRQAVMRLGMAVLSEIAIAVCLQGETFRTPGYETLRRKMLLHAFVAGGFAKELARTKRRNVEALFLCGLLHSIGRPVVLHLLSALQRTLQPRLTEGEAAGLVDEFARQAGVAVTKAWQLPQQVQMAAAYHDNPDAAPAFNEEARLTALASRLAGWVVAADPGDEAAVRGLPAWSELNYYPDEVDGVLARREALEASASAFMA